MRPLVSISILTYNRKDLSSACIPKIINNIGNVSAEVLIWDNFSNDGTYDWLLDYKKADLRVTKVFEGKKNIGVEAINNLARAAKGKYLIKVDDDIGVPQSFAEKLVSTYEEVNEDNLAVISWDMLWRDTTFATRSGKSLYKGSRGNIINLSTGGQLFITYDPSSWLLNGACRFTPRDKFLEVGGHPEGILYGVDYLFSKRLAKKGYWGAYLHGAGLIEHLGVEDSKEYRAFKDSEIRRIGAPMHH